MVERWPPKMRNIETVTARVRNPVGGLPVGAGNRGSNALHDLPPEQGSRSHKQMGEVLLGRAGVGICTWSNRRGPQSDTDYQRYGKTGKKKPPKAEGRLGVRSSGNNIHLLASTKMSIIEPSSSR